MKSTQDKNEFTLQCEVENASSLSPVAHTPVLPAESPSKSSNTQQSSVENNETKKNTWSSGLSVPEKYCSLTIHELCMLEEKEVREIAEAIGVDNTGLKWEILTRILSPETKSYGEKSQIEELLKKQKIRDAKAVRDANLLVVVDSFLLDCGFSERQLSSINKCLKAGIAYGHIRVDPEAGLDQILFEGSFKDGEEGCAVCESYVVATLHRYARFDINSAHCLHCC